MANPILLGWKKISDTLSGFRVRDSSGNEYTAVDSDGYLYQRGTKITETASNINNLSTDIESINTQLAQTTNVLTPLLGEFSPLTILVSGDSITSGVGTTTKTWHDYLHDWLGCTIINDGKSATGIIRADGSTPGIYTRIDTWDTSYADFDMILIMGNMNDGGIGEATFPVGSFTDTIATDSQYGALHSTIQKLLTKYPHKPIGWIISTPRLANGTYPAPHNGAAWGVDGWFEPYCQAIKTVCNHYAIPCLDLYHESNLRPWKTVANLAYFNAADGVHPNAKGHEIIAYKIHEFVKQYLGANCPEKTSYVFEQGSIQPNATTVSYIAATARARMKESFGVYKPGIYTVNDPAKHNLAVYLFQNPVRNGDLTSGYLANGPAWATSQRVSNANATHIQMAMKNLSGVDFTASELTNMNKYITFIPD